MALTFQDNRLLDPAVQAMLLQRIKQMRGKGFQQDVQFGDVYKNGAYDFSKYDQLVNNARAQGLSDITFRLYGTPTYVEKTRPGVATQLSANHPNAAMAGKFAEAVAQHFKGRVGRYGVWNEPNVGSFINRDTPIAAQEYRRLYRKMYSSLKGVDPHNRVGLGEVTSQQPSTSGVLSTIGFLQKVLAGPKPLHADYVSIHPYQWSDPSKKVGTPEFGGISNLDAVQQFIRKMQREGHLSTNKGGRPELAASEYGYKHAIANPAQRKAWLKRSMDIFRRAGVDDVNLYQLLPSKPGDYWDSSILGPQGQVPASFRNLMPRRR